MSDEETPPLPSNDFRMRVFASLGWKAFLLFLLGLLLLIPLGMIEGLLRERASRKDEATAEIAEQWSASQVLLGPFLRLPFTRLETVEEAIKVDGYLNRRLKQVKVDDALWLLPDRFRLKGVLYPEMRYRGIFRMPAYNSSFDLKGAWEVPDLAALKLAEAEFDWGAASIVFRVTDPRGVSSIQLADEVGEPRLPHPLILPGLGEWVEIAFPMGAEAEKASFDLRFELRGSGSLKFLPMGRDGEARLESSWPDPSFQGGLAPSERTVGPDGFSARWSFGEFGRGFAQSWMERSAFPTLASLGQASTGVDLLDSVDGYRMTERSLKYGSLFVALGFAVFFLFETLCGLRLSLMNYLLAGVAQAVFFMLVLALSEVLAFSVAYGVAASAAVCLISLYAAAALRAFKRAAIVAGVLSGLYAVLLVILQQQDYALLAGSGLVFVGLAAFMYLTRRIDWQR